MKKIFIPVSIALASMTLLTGCLGLAVGTGTTVKQEQPTVGQQLIDLQKAKDSGAITQAEYDSQKAKILSQK
jgi:Short C-terminal domain